MFSALFPAIRVHSWGGFGSQLFALVACWNLSRKYPRRRVTLYIHTSGVTKRHPEIHAFVGDLRVVVLDDYKEVGPSLDYSLSTKSITWYSKRLFIGISKMLATKIGILSNLNSAADYRELKPWIISVRGHYTGVPIDQVDLAHLKMLFEKLSNQTCNKFAKNGILTVQYRLGDLINLEDKSYISPATVSALIANELANQDCSSVFILTDSPLEVKKILANKVFDYQVNTLTPISTIRGCIDSEFFIGTNSKISIWAALLRALNGKTSLLPIGFKNNMTNYLVGNHISLVSFYENEF